MSEKISQMTSGNPAQTSDLIPIARSGANYSVTAGSLAALASGPSFGGGDSAWFYGPGITVHPFTLSNLGVIQSCQAGGSFVTPGQVIVYLFELTETFVIGSCSEQANDNIDGHTSAFGIYDEAGNLVVNGGSFNSLTSPLVQTNTFTPVTLEPGMYWHAQACSSTGVTSGFSGFIFSGSEGYEYLSNTLGKNATRFGLSENVATQGPNNPQGNPTCLLPSTLGTITPFVLSGNSDGVISPLWE